MLLISPGPTTVPERVLRAGAEPMIHHRSERFGQALKETLVHLRTLFGATDAFVIPGSGRSAIEAALVNSLSPGDRILVITNGRFGEMLAATAGDLGLDVVAALPDWNRPVDPMAIDRMLDDDPTIDAIGIVHSETSTSILNDIRAVGSIARKYGKITIVDAVSSFGGVPINMEEDNVDFVASASQKCLMSPPGLGLLGVGPNAWSSIEKARSFRSCLDLRKMREAANRPTPQTPGTSPVSLIRCLHEALRMIMEEGPEAVYARHEKLACATRAGVAALGLSLVPAGDLPRPASVTTIGLPEGCDGGKFCKEVLARHNVYLGEGLARLQKTTFRIGHMGAIQGHHVVRALRAIGQTLAAGGWISADPEAGAGAAQEVLG